MRGTIWDLWGTPRYCSSGDVPGGAWGHRGAYIALLCLYSMQLGPPRGDRPSTGGYGTSYNQLHCPLG